jgi:hypothetical protein
MIKGYSVDKIYCRDHVRFRDYLAIIGLLLPGR